MISNLFRRLFPEITYEWCVVGSTIGRHVWKIEKRKCINGEPLGAGGFLTIYKCSDKEIADEIYKHYSEIAQRINRKNNFL